ncbi:GntR family transcriptional regulator [Kaistia terrae]|uniref:GntR family transcriptional regulator n=1 Tax=Kaistia terrae TaxID=537017 RepID=A0ABW0PYS6_9HYPH|nr:GntR family transcriptional regulator [Kaistia terrae]MCX5581435.1 GntR family transcriptional regulator [Kaistia terrae]
MAQAAEAPTKLSQIAYQRFKEALFSRQIPIGATVSQGELAELLQVQTGALREAMQLLEKEGFLTVLPRSGIRIVKPDMSHLKDCFQMRRVIEAEAVRRFAERATMVELADWRVRHEGIIELARGGTVESALIKRSAEVDQAFHVALVEGTRNPLMISAHAHMMEQIGVIRLDNMYMLSALAIIQTMQEHLGVIAALEAQDPEAAVTAMDAHLARAMHRAMGL